MMGLDGVELIMAVEKKFGIEISDDEGWRTRTPRQLCDLVASKVELAATKTCQTQRAFYVLRSVISTDFSLPKQQLRPTTSLESVIPKVNRRIAWLQLRQEVGAADWPGLKFSPGIANSLAISIFALWLAVTVLTVWIGRRFAPRDWLYAAPFVSGVLVALLAYGVLRRLQPHQTSLAGQTMETLANHLVLVAYSPELLGPQPGQWTKERVRAVVRGLISEQLGVPPDFDDDADFVRDLKVD